MNSRITRLTSDVRREGLTWEERWEGVDQGLIVSWERGQDMQRESPELAVRALAGELVVLPWKGGVVNDRGNAVALQDGPRGHLESPG